MKFRCLGWEDPLEEGTATHSSFLAWRIPRTEESGGLQSIGWPRVGPDWSNSACMHTYNWLSVAGKHLHLGSCFGLFYYCLLTVLPINAWVRRMVRGKWGGPFYIFQALTWRLRKVLVTVAYLPFEVHIWRTMPSVVFCGLQWGSGWPCSHTTLTYSIWDCRLHSVIFHLPRKALLPHQSRTSSFKPRDDSRQLLVRQANGLLCRSLSRTLVIQDCSGNNCHWTWVYYRSHLSGGFQWLWSFL